MLVRNLQARYIKTVSVGTLQTFTLRMQHLFLEMADPVKRAKLNDTMGKINCQWGRGTLRLASAGFNHGMENAAEQRVDVRDDLVGGHSAGGVMR